MTCHVDRKSLLISRYRTAHFSKALWQDVTVGNETWCRLKRVIYLGEVLLATV